jgi:Co/Zn/Cd efflux system component
VEERNWKLTMAITGAMMVVKQYGLLTGSLALISDAGHMFTIFALQSASELFSKQESATERLAYRVKYLQPFSTVFFFCRYLYFICGIKRIIHGNVLKNEMFIIVLPD